MLYNSQGFNIVTFLSIMGDDSLLLLMKLLRPLRRLVLSSILEFLAFVEGLVHSVCLVLSRRIYLVRSNI